MKTAIIVLLWLLAAAAVIAAAQLAYALYYSPVSQPATTAAWVQLLQLAVALIAAIAAGVGSYFTFFVPFKPTIQLGAYTWRIRPLQSPNLPVEVALWVSAVNEGALTGMVEDFAIRLKFPRGEWFLQPVFALDSEKYLGSLSAPNDASSLPAREPFAPLMLRGKSEVTKTLLFLPVEGHADPAFLEPGVFQLRFYARDSRSSKFRELGSRKIVLDPGMLERWEKGQTIAGAQIERPTDPKPLIRAMDLEN